MAEANSLQPEWPEWAQQEWPGWTETRNQLQGAGLIKALDDVHPRQYVSDAMLQIYGLSLYEICRLCHALQEDGVPGSRNSPGVAADDETDEPPIEEQQVRKKRKSEFEDMLRCSTIEKVRTPTGSLPTPTDSLQWTGTVTPVFSEIDYSVPALRQSRMSVCSSAGTVDEPWMHCLRTTTRASRSARPTWTGS